MDDGAGAAACFAARSAKEASRSVSEEVSAAIEVWVSEGEVVVGSSRMTRWRKSVRERIIFMAWRRGRISAQRTKRVRCRLETRSSLARESEWRMRWRM